MRFSYPLAVAGLALTAPSAVQACRDARNPAIQIEADYAAGRIESAAIAEITAIGATGEGKSDAQPWEAKASIVASVFGPKFEGTAEFIYNLVVSNCGWPTKLQAGLGQRIVLYFRREKDGDRIVARAMDLDDAIHDDPKVKAWAWKVDLPDVTAAERP